MELRCPSRLMMQSIVCAKPVLEVKGAEAGASEANRQAEEEEGRPDVGEGWLQKRHREQREASPVGHLVQ
jgi:hypothetical protein